MTEKLVLTTDNYPENPSMVSFDCHDGTFHNLEKFCWRRWFYLFVVKVLRRGDREFSIRMIDFDRDIV